MGHRGIAHLCTASACLSLAAGLYRENVGSSLLPIALYSIAAWSLYIRDPRGRVFAIGVGWFEIVGSLIWFGGAFLAARADSTVAVVFATLGLLQFGLGVLKVRVLDRPDVRRAFQVRTRRRRRSTRSEMKGEDGDDEGRPGE